MNAGELMLFGLGCFLLGVFVGEIRRAPRGEQDEHGFHYLRRSTDRTERDPDVIDLPHFAESRGPRHHKRGA